MRPASADQELFEAFTAINERAYADPRLVANHVLTKAPHCDDIARRFREGRTPAQPGRLRALWLAARYYAVNLAAFGLLGAAAAARALSGQRGKSRLREFVRRAAAEKKSVTVVDVFALVRRIAEQERFEETYLPGLPEALEEAGRAPVLLTRLYGSRDPRLLYRVFRAFSRHPRPVLTEFDLFRLSDWGALFLHLLTFPFAVRRLAGTLATTGAQGHVRRALWECLGQCYLPGAGRRLAGRRLGELLPPGSSVISWHENQVVDKCFYKGLRGANPAVALYGAQLFVWPPELLNNHPDRADARHGLCPDVVAVNGSHFLPDFPPEGAGAPRYRVGPALRYRFLHEARQGRPALGKPLLALLSYHPGETRRVLALLRQAAPALAARGIPVVYRFHPATRPAGYADLLPDDPAFEKRPLPEALGDAGAVIGSGSGALAEAVALGVGAIAVEGGPGSLNYLPALGRGSLWESARTPDDVVALYERFCEAPPDPMRTAAFREALFARPDAGRLAEAFDLELSEDTPEKPASADREEHP